tara:strand:+ start:725 stop:883 length:159 start_codon:yes stop_codon:yes gene_type:complete
MQLFLILKEIIKYAKARKKIWLLPFAIILVALAVVLVTTQGTVVAPFIYTLF